MEKILLIDDDILNCDLLGEIIQGMGFQPITASNGTKGLELVKQNRFIAVFTDLNMPKMGGMEVLARLKEIDSELPVIMITAYGSIQLAVEAMKLGAMDFIIKPFTIGQIEMIIKKIKEQLEIKQENLKLKELLRRSTSPPGVIGNDPSMQTIFSLIDKVAGTDSTVLITGESGTGKELIARAIHQKSGRVSEKFVALNCAAFSDTLLESELFGYEKGAFTGAASKKLGLLEVASGGSVFLDEIGETSPQFQVKLLRVMQVNEFLRVGGTEPIKVDIRYIAATNKDLIKEINSGTFRTDLFYRLNVFPIHLPPLRERKGDISLLINHFIEKYSKKRGWKKGIKIDKKVINLLMKYEWPGNIRELENVIERALILSHDHELSLEVLPQEILALDNKYFVSYPLEDITFKEARVWFETWYFQKLLNKFNGNVTKVAKIAGLRRETIHEKIRHYSIER